MHIEFQIVHFPKCSPSLKYLVLRWHAMASFLRILSQSKSNPKSKVKRTWSDSILLLYHDVYSLMHFYSDVLERWDNQDVLDVPREERVLLMQCLDWTNWGKRWQHFQHTLNNRVEITCIIIHQLIAIDMHMVVTTMEGMTTMKDTITIIENNNLVQTSDL